MTDSLEHEDSDGSYDSDKDEELKGKMVLLVGSPKINALLVGSKKTDALLVGPLPFEALLVGPDYRRNKPCTFSGSKLSRCHQQHDSFIHSHSETLNRHQSQWVYEDKCPPGFLFCFMLAN